MEQTIREQQAAALARTGGYYKHICWMALPLVCMSAYLYGLRPVLLCLAALLTGNLCDRLVALLRRRVYNPGDWSNESFALLIALLMPATVSWYVLVVAVVAGVLLGKEAFGGYGSYPFHPAAVGYVVAAVSWPEQVFLYPQPYADIPLWDPSGVALVNGMSSTLRNGGLPTVSAWPLVLGEFAAPMGAGAVPVHPERPQADRRGQLSGCLRGDRLFLPAAGRPSAHRRAGDGGPAAESCEIRAGQRRDPLQRGAADQRALHLPAAGAGAGAVRPAAGLYQHELPLFRGV